MPGIGELAGEDADDEHGEGEDHIGARSDLGVEVWSVWA